MIVNKGGEHQTAWANLHLQCRHLIPALNTWTARAHSTRPNARLQPSFLGMDDLNVILIRKLRGSLMYFDYFLTCLYNQALADVRSTGVGIKSLYCDSKSLGTFSLTSSRAELSKSICLKLSLAS